MADNESVVGKAARAAGRKPGATPAASKPVAEDLYKAEYVGSGTFKIKKPKRNSRKTHQQRVKNDRRGRI
jgi:hypothetical protein